MAHHLAEFLRRQQDAGWRALAGTNVRGTLPMSDALLREVVVEALREQLENRGIRLIGVTVLADEVVRMEVVVGGSLLSKRFSPEVRLSGVHGLPDAPSVTVTVPRQYGWLAAQALRRQPVGYVRSEGQVLTIDLGALVEQQWGEDATALLTLLKRADLRSEPGSLFVDFEVAVP